MREKRLSETIAKRNSILNNVSDDFWQTIEMIPNVYRYEFAMLTIAGYFDTGRAETLKEALNLFETEKHQWRMEDIQIKQAAMMTAQLDSIRRSSAISAGANVANAIYNFSQ